MKDGLTPMKHMRTADQLPSIEELRHRFDYDPVTGVIRWKNSKYPALNGKRAGSIDKSIGRRVIILKPYRMYAARVAWAIHHGEWPKGIIDHEDRNKLNDKLSNLIDTGAIGNARNSDVQENSTTGVTGVSWVRRDQKFAARIYVEGRCISLGHYTTLDAAARERRKAEKKYWGASA